MFGEDVDPADLMNHTLTHLLSEETWRAPSLCLIVSVDMNRSVVPLCQV